MGRNLYARLVAYQPHGDRIGVLPQPASFDALQEWDETGSLSFEYSMLTVGGDTISRQLSTGTEIAVEVSDGGAWVEPASMRYLIIKREGDQTDTTGTLKFTCVSYGWLLNKILNLNTSALRADGDNKGKRPFLSATAGTIISTFVDENKARGGAGAYLAPGFDTGKDSAGAGWSRVSTLYYSLGVSLKTVIDGLVQGGVIDWDTQGRTLRVWNADSIKRSRDLSRTVIVQLAKDVLGIPYEESIEDLSSHILVSGDNDLIFTEDNPAAPTPWGKWESYVSQGGVSDKGTAQAFMQAELASSARMRGSYTAEMLTVDATNLPLIDYQCGDWITAPTISHGEKTRVQQIKLALDNTNGGASITCSVTLNDALMDSQVRQAKKINGISGGAALAGSESSRPAPAQDHRVPAAPQGLVVDTDAYIDENGWARGLVVATWGEVTEATDNTAIDVENYEVQWRRNVAGAPWMRAGWTDETTLAWSDMDCGIMIEVRVRAIPQYSDKSGEWSDTVVVEVASDVTPPSVPSRPVLSSDMGGVIVHWDGLNESGGGMESDFDHLVVSRGQSTGDMTVIDAEATGKGDWLDFSGLTPGATYYYALAAVDHAGNRSDWSESASVVVVSTVSQEQIDKIQSDLQQAQSDLDEAEGTLDRVQSDLSGVESGLEQANRELDSVAADAADAVRQAQEAYEQATTAKKTADGLHNIFKGWQDPATMSGVTVKTGDFWYRTQQYWTTSQGDPDNSPSLCANFYTYAQGEPDNSPSVLVPLESEVVEVLTWDGTRWNRFDLVASNVIASGSIVGDLIAANAITAGHLSANSVTTDKLVSLAVTADKLAANSVVAGKIAANAVTTGALAALAVTADKLAANSVTAGKLTSNAVTTDKLAANSVTGVKIAARTITADRIAAGTITSYEIKTGSITSDTIASGAITTDKLAAGAITAEKIAAGAITADAIRTGRLSDSGNLNYWDLDSGDMRIRDGSISISGAYGGSSVTTTIDSSGLRITSGSNTVAGLMKDASGDVVLRAGVMGPSSSNYLKLSSSNAMQLYASGSELLSIRGSTSQSTGLVTMQALGHTFLKVGREPSGTNNSTVIQDALGDTYPRLCVAPSAVYAMTGNSAIVVSDSGWGETNGVALASSGNTIEINGHRDVIQLITNGGKARIDLPSSYAALIYDSYHVLVDSNGISFTGPVNGLSAASARLAETRLVALADEGLDLDSPDAWTQTPVAIDEIGIATIHDVLRALVDGDRENALAILDEAEANQRVWTQRDLDLFDACASDTDEEQSDDTDEKPGTTTTTDEEGA